MLQNLNRIMNNQSQVIDTGFANPDQAVTDAGFVYLDPDKIVSAIVR